MKLTHNLLGSVLVLAICFSALAQKPEKPKFEKPPGGLHDNVELDEKALFDHKDLDKKAKISLFDHKHAQFNKVLSEYVVIDGASSTVKYAKLKESPAELDKYLVELSVVTQAEFDKWDRNQQMAFLINAYNAFTLKHIINHYPTDSIKSIGSIFTNPWKIKFFNLLGKKRHLDWIEHEVLRKNYNEPRIHFAINCASIGCPMLKDTAYTPKALNDQLEEQTRIFIRDQSRNYIKGQQLYVSKIFDWFEEDFKNVYAFVAKYYTDDFTTKDQILAKKYKLRFSNYDWNLNDFKKPNAE